MLGGVIGREAAVAAELQAADAERAVGKERRDAHDALRHHEEGALLAGTFVGVEARFVDDAVVERRTERCHETAAERARAPAVRGDGECAHARGALTLPVPVATQGERV